MKFKRVNFYGGSADFPESDSYYEYTARYSRSCKIVTGIADALISMNIGWTVDTTRTSSTTDYSQVPARSGNETFPGLFLKNTDSNNKLFICYFATTKEKTISQFDGSALIKTNTTSPDNHSGLIMSMLPSNSTQDFGQLDSTSFLPQYATRLIGTVICQSTYHQTIGAYVQSGYTYTYGVFATPYVVGISVGSSQGSTPILEVPTYIVGRIIGTLAHTEDNLPNSKYGVLVCRKTLDEYNGHESGESKLGVCYFSQNYLFGDYNSSRKYVGFPEDSTYTFVNTNNYLVGSVSKANGNYILGTDKSTYYVGFKPTDLAQVSGYLYSIPQSGSSRWTPYSIFCLSNDLNTFGVVPGDGFKGYIDPDILRCANGNFGQMYDNGNLICCSYNLLIGWDSTNTDTLS